MTAEQMLKAVFWYQAIGTIAAIIIGLALVFYRRRRQIEKDQNPPPWGNSHSAHQYSLQRGL